MKTFQEYLDVILTKELEALSPGELKFLRARQSYLSSEQLLKYQLTIPNTKVQYANTTQTTDSGRVEPKNRRKPKRGRPRRSKG